MRRLELLSPAKNLKVALAAIQNGADAVYIGGPAFGARKAVGNSIEDITRLVSVAHRFYCRVFVTMNTLLYDEELSEAEKLIKALYRVGVDAIIIQDPGILKLDIPPIALHASTQMHNYELERIKFLDKIGFQRIVLARELSLEEIKKIRQEVSAELEYRARRLMCQFKRTVLYVALSIGTFRQSGGMCSGLPYEMERGRCDGKTFVEGEACIVFKRPESFRSIV